MHVTQLGRLGSSDVFREVLAREIERENDHLSTMELDHFDLEG